MLIVNSGGAKGADSEWCKGFVDETDFHLYGFAQFRIRHPTGTTYHELSSAELAEAMPAIRSAVASLGKQMTTSFMKLRFLQRDYHIIRGVDAVYAVGKLNPGFGGLQVDGGTGMGCQMYWNGGGRNLFFYDQDTDEWKQPNPEGVWQVLASGPPPVSTFSKIACIGSREMTEKALEVIRSI